MKNKKLISSLLVICMVFVLFQFSTTASIENIAKEETKIYTENDILPQEEVSKFVNYESAKASGHVKVEEMTADSITYLNYDNTYTTYLFAEEIAGKYASGNVEGNMSLLTANSTYTSNTNTGIQDAIVHSQNPNTNYGSAQTASVYDAYLPDGYSRLLVSFPGLENSSILTSSSITVYSANFYIYCFSGGGLPASIFTYMNTGSVWNENQVTWNDINWNNSTYDEGGTTAIDGGPGLPDPYAPLGYQAFNITNTVLNWKNGIGSPSKGISLRGEFGLHDGMKAFYTKEYALANGLEYMPYLIINYRTSTDIPVVEDGIYALKNVESNQYLCYEGLNNPWFYHSTYKQPFLVDYNKDTGYSYISISSNNYPAHYLTYGSTALTVYSTALSNTSYWKIEETDSGAFKLITKNSYGTSDENVLADDSPASTNGSIKIREYTDDDNYQDEWVFEKISTSGPIANGVYILNNATTRKYLNVEGASGYKYTGYRSDFAQEMTLQLQSNGYYTIRTTINYDSWNYLTVEETINGKLVLGTSSNITDKAYWKITRGIGGNYKIMPKYYFDNYEHYSLADDNQATSSNGNIALREYTFDSNYQDEWKFEKIPITNGVYTIRSNYSGSKYLNVDEVEYRYKYEFYPSTTAQQMTIEYQNNGYYTIKTMIDGSWYYLSVTKTLNNSLILSASAALSNNVYWKITTIPFGGYSISPKVEIEEYSGKALYNNNTSITLNAPNNSTGTSPSSWNFIKIS